MTEAAAKRAAIIVSASSDIGHAMAKRWAAREWEVLGTYRTHSRLVDDLAAHGAKMVSCDLAHAA